jgi:quercetin dioxygenase-like cupin family protein
MVTKPAATDSLLTMVLSAVPGEGRMLAIRLAVGGNLWRQSMRHILLATTVVLGITGGAVLAQDHKANAISADSVKWGPAPPMLPKGVQIAVLAGDPGKKGPFVVRLKIPPGLKVPAHQHPTDEVVTVISGDFRFGMGDKLDESKAEKLGPGGFVDLPANMNHFAFSGGGEVIVQINSEGPFEIKYANPADDPSKKS